MSYGWNRFDTVARRMLRPADWDRCQLAPSLYDLLDRADDLCISIGAELHSRQVVSAIVVLWQLMNPSIPPVRLTDEHRTS